MKVGDLVKWTHPKALDYGLVLALGEDRRPEGYWDGHILIEWHANPEHSGLYPADHELLELINESR